MARRSDPHLTHLQSIPLFADCTRAELEEIAEVATELHFSPGQILIHEGGTGHELIVIVEGRVKVTRGGKDIAELGPGDVLGEMALLSHRPRNASAAAVTDVEALIIDGRSFGPLLDDVHGLAKKLLFAVVRRVEDEH